MWGARPKVVRSFDAEPTPRRRINLDHSCISKLVERRTRGVRKLGSMSSSRTTVTKWTSPTAWVPAEAEGLHYIDDFRLGS